MKYWGKVHCHSCNHDKVVHNFGWVSNTVISVIYQIFQNCNTYFFWLIWPKLDQIDQNWWNISFQETQKIQNTEICKLAIQTFLTDLDFMDWETQPFPEEFYYLI